MKRAIYATCYLATIYVLTVSVFFPKHRDALQIVFYVVISLSLTLLSSTATIKSMLYLFLSPWHLWYTSRRINHQQKSTARMETLPLVSVIIPAYNEAVGLIPTIKTVLNSSYDNFEIVIINDGSTDNSDALMCVFLQKYEYAMCGHVHVPITYHYQQNGGKGSALNAGIRLSHGDIIVSIDSDCVMHQECLANFVQAFFDPEVMGVAGNIKIGNTDTVLGETQAIEYALGLYGRKADAILNTIYIVGGASGAFRREVFTKIGYYATDHITEDLDLSFRMQQAGMRIAYAPGAVVYTECPTTWQGLLKQRLRWTRGRFDTLKKQDGFFFSRKQEHSKWLTWFLLPLVVVNDWLYVLKIAMKLALYIYCIVTNDMEMLGVAVVMNTLIMTLALWDDREHLKYLYLAPISWLLFNIPAVIEVHSVIFSVWGMLRKKEVKWQKWQRQGAISK